MTHYTKATKTFLAKRKTHENRDQFKETAIRGAFHELMEEIKPKGFYTKVEPTQRTSAGRHIYYDMMLLNEGGLPWGFVENKDVANNFDKEVSAKKESLYSFDNIIFENGYEAWLYQDGVKVAEAIYMASQSPLIKKYYDASADLSAFDHLLYQFLSYVPKGARGFNERLELFKSSVPVLADQIRLDIELAYGTNKKFKNNFDDYSISLKKTIGDSLSHGDIIEMLIQHILTADLFHEILGSDDYRNFNTIAKTLDSLKSDLGREFDHNISAKIKPYYQALAENIKKMGALHYSIEALRIFYETFYQAYDSKNADTYGIVYTPSDIVAYMVNMADSLLYEHFGKHIYSKGVEILDPCTGTGSFMVAILSYIATHARGELEYKFMNELHANELSILAYYIGNVHIELQYKELSGGLFGEFDHMCYVDTLDNDFASHKASDKAIKQERLLDLGAITEENARRVKRQNEATIRLIIGNPPYNANQQNENQNNKNRRYAAVDSRVADTYSQNSNAQKRKLTDMYVRFIRWASDRLNSADGGMLAFITNRSFLDAFGFDGFRYAVAGEYSHIYSIDLGGDIRRGGMGGNVFNIMTGVAITFFIKSNKRHGGIRYLNPFSPTDSGDDKLYWLKHHSNREHSDHAWQLIEPNTAHTWLNQSTSNWPSLLPLGDKKLKGKADAPAIFSLYSLGVITARDSWMYGHSAKELTCKVKYFIDVYDSECDRWQAVSPEEKGQAAWQKEQYLDNFVTTRIKWERELKKVMTRGIKVPFNQEKIVTSLYRPFTLRKLYYEGNYLNCTYQMPSIFPTGRQGENLVICVSKGQRRPSQVFITEIIPNLDIFMPDSNQVFPLYRYSASGQQSSNISPAYRARFGPTVTDQQLFYYIYALLHHPTYRTIYAVDLAQSLPRVPISPAFATLSTLGQQLAQLHLSFSTCPPYPAELTTTEGAALTPKLKSYPTKGTIVLDNHTTLSAIPSEAWAYRLGNRSAIDWVLEGYKEKSISTDNGDIANPYSPLYKEHGYQPYRYADAKQECIEAVGRIITLSLKTQELIEQIATHPLEG